MPESSHDFMNAQLNRNQSPLLLRPSRRASQPRQSCNDSAFKPRIPAAQKEISRAWIFSPRCGHSARPIHGSPCRLHVRSSPRCPSIDNSGETPRTNRQHGGDAGCCNKRAYCVAQCFDTESMAKPSPPPFWLPLLNAAFGYLLASQTCHSSSSGPERRRRG